MSEWKEFSAKTVEEAIALAAEEFSADQSKLEVEVIEEASNGFLGLFNNKPAKIKARIKEVDICNIASTFLTNVLKCMDIEANLEVVNNPETETVEIQIIGDDMGILIGKRGQTLDSLQYLVSLVVNKESEKYLKVKLDTENYRERREETLKNLAKNIASKVKRSHRAVTLEPMNPYERRIIHSALQDDKYVETHSEGEEPFRKVVVTPKKGVSFDNGRRGGKYQGGKRFDSRGGYNNGKKKISNSREFHKRYGADTKDYSTDYKKDYANYLESKAAAKAAEAQAQAESKD